MLALARKYRPKRFADVAVQHHVSNTLRGAIAAKRVAHGYLLSGPRGVGKTTLARVLAMALNCEQGAPGGEPCGVCSSCTRIWQGSASLDVVEIDAASNRGVDDARDLRERAMYAPSGDDRYKVYIVDEAHMLTRDAWNALLKILEEPPPRVVFVFATTEAYKISQAAAPVMSRLQRFDLKRIGPAEIRKRLEEVLKVENVRAEPEALTMISRAADGSMRDALSLTDQVMAMGDGNLTAERAREALGLVAEDEYLALLDIIAERRAGDVFPFIGRLADAGVDFGQFMAGLGDILRAQLSVVLGGETADVSDQARGALVARKDKLSSADLLRMLNVMAESEIRFKRSGQQQLLVETMLVRFALMDRTVALEDVLRAIGGPASGSGPPGSGSRSAPPARDRNPSQSSSSSTGGGSSRSTAAPSADASGRTGAPRPAPTAPAPTKPGPPAMDSSLARDVSADVKQPPMSLPDLAALTGRWDDLAERVRADGKALLGAALHVSSPKIISRTGELTVELDEPNDFHAKAIEQGSAYILSVLGDWFTGLTSVRVFRDEALKTTEERPKRVTDDMVRAERLNGLRRKDPALDAAIDVLDLEIPE